MKKKWSDMPSANDRDAERREQVETRRTACGSQPEPIDRIGPMDQQPAQSIVSSSGALSQWMHRMASGNFSTVLIGSTFLNSGRRLHRRNDAVLARQHAIRRETATGPMGHDEHVRTGLQVGGGVSGLDRHNGNARWNRDGS